MTALMQQIRQVAPSNASVLITGANGTGKELVARTLHRLSRRADRPLVEVNCAAIPEELIESELFGHEKGAFTGADRTKRGRFELADGGTLFLDEIGDMSLKTQSKILRILQEQQFQRVGGAKTFSVDVRIIAATNKNLEEEIARGVFREDLFYRLNVIPLHVPLLKDRREDIPPLIEEFLAEFSTENNTEPKTIAPEAMASLAARDWPGNVRELRNAIERLVIMTPGPVIASVDLDRGPASPAALPQGLAGVLAAPSLKEARAEAERAYLRAKLAEHQGNVTQTAEAIGLDRTSLHKKIRALGLGVSGE
jgi:two-component system nitrogen regulation response regulator NtrX